LSDIGDRARERKKATTIETATPLPAERLAWHCDPRIFEFQTTVEVGGMTAS
jgi:hypothetical protein